MALENTSDIEHLINMGGGGIGFEDEVCRWVGRVEWEMLKSSFSGRNEESAYWGVWKEIL